MKKLIMIAALFTSGIVNAYDKAYVYKLSCGTGGTFFGAPVDPVSSAEIFGYMPVDVNGSFCRVYTRNRSSIGPGTSCNGFRAERTEMKVSECEKAN